MKLDSTRKLFFPYLMADFPTPDSFRALFRLTARYADLIEIGIPFSDPVADGPVIRQAGEQVLKNGFELGSIFEFLRTERTSVPVALMSYANPVLAFGQARFFDECRRAGVSGAIIPDVPFEEAGPWRAPASEHGVSLIPFVALTTGGDRLQRICASAEGFIYLVSLTGITGSAITANEAIRRKAREIRSHTPTHVPVALGFGIKSPSDAVAFSDDDIDAFIVGSKIMELAQADAGFGPVKEFYEQFRREVIR